MTSTVSGGNITSGFIDLATFDELERYFYGGDDAITYFIRETTRCTLFTQVPVSLSRTSGSANFNSEWSVAVSRAGDYLLHTWLRATFPDVTPANNGYKLLWTRNLMHNLVKEAAVTFNELVAMRFDNYFLDFYTAFTVQESKRNAYNNMIGANIQGFSLDSTLNSDDLKSDVNTATTYGRTLNLPLPYFFSRDSGVSLPVAALPYNDTRLAFRFRDWTELLLIMDCSSQIRPATASDVQSPQNINLSNVSIWANYAVVSNDERQRMGCGARDILIEQVQTFAPQPFKPSDVNTVLNYDVRFAHAVKATFFAVRNKTIASEWSNYSTVSTNPNGYRTLSQTYDPLSKATLVYENTVRMNMDIDYYALINPYYHADAIPKEPGYHLYSYALSLSAVDVQGSTNYGKITNASWQFQASQPAIDGINGTLNGTAQIYDAVIVVLNHNVVRISGGVLGFPVL